MLRSGAWKGSANDLRARMNTAVRQAVQEAIADVWQGKYKQTVAMETGMLRSAIERALKMKGAGNLKINIGEVGLNYAKYHIYGDSGEATSDQPYKKPSTIGTKPLNEANLIRELAMVLRERLVVNFERAGLKTRSG